MGLTSARDLQLDAWRSACRHLDLSEAIEALAPAVDRVIPIEAMWILSVGEARCTLSAAWRRDGQAVPPFSVREGPAVALARFIRRGGLATFDPERPGRSLLAPLAVHLGTGPVLCGALRRDGVSEGIVVVRLRGRTPEARSIALLAATLEPLAVALENARRYRELEALKRAAEAEGQSALRRLGRRSLEDPVVGAEGGLRPVMERVQVVASSDVPVLILGETGSGKEVIARAIHERSARHAGPFLRVNCGAIAPDLIDSELFGHERGAFTGATDRRKGWFERADGGTLFLDEVGELSPAAQVRLLRVTQEGTLERVGGQETVRVDCRIVAATHRDLSSMVRERSFREDLWYRLSIFPILLPPLRDRREDLAPLARVFAERAAMRFGLHAVELRDSDIALLERYDWPGNVRELAAVIDRATLLGKGERLAVAAAMGVPDGVDRHVQSVLDFPHEARRWAVEPTATSEPDRPRIASLDDAMRSHIETALAACNGRVEGPRGVARALRINAHTLRSRMRKLGIDWKRFRSAVGPD